MTMRMRLSSILIILLSVSVAGSVWAEEGKNMFAKGTMQAGGIVGIRVDAVNPDDGDNGDDTEGLVIRLSPSFGYFVIDNLELGLALDLQFPKLEMYEDSQFNASVLGSIRYIIPVKVVAPYFGLAFGGGGYYFTGPDMDFLLLNIPLGVLIPMNEHFAFNVGLRMNFQFFIDGDDYLGFLFTMPAGYLGVEGFF